MTSAWIQELFASIQGEGPWVGQRHVFARFQGCDLGCSYCDTPAAVADDRPPICMVRSGIGAPDAVERVPNPVSARRLTELCRQLAITGPAKPIISLTGGEPLLQSDFLAEWLPEARKDFRIYLETNGIRYGDLRRLTPMIDVISMDIKLPSASGQGELWKAHQRFLAAAAGKELFVKAVITNDTVRSEVDAAAHLVADVDAALPFVIQPATGARAPSSSQLIALQESALRILGDVRVIPQIHHGLGVP